MPSFELTKLQAVTASRPLSDTNRAAGKPAGAAPASAANGGAAPAGVTLEVNGSIDTAAAPVDTDRVSQIREALKDGTYPLIPIKITDAMIAAQFIIGTEE